MPGKAAKLVVTERQQTTLRLMTQSSTLRKEWPSEPA